MPAKHVKSRREDRDYEDLVRLYLEDVGRHDLLTKDDEVRLAQAIEAGVAARTQLEAAKKQMGSISSSISSGRKLSARVVIAISSMIGQDRANNSLASRLARSPSAQPPKFFIAWPANQPISCGRSRA